MNEENEEPIIRGAGIRSRQLPPEDAARRYLVDEAEAFITRETLKNPLPMLLDPEIASVFNLSDPFDLARRARWQAGQPYTVTAAEVLEANRKAKAKEEDDKRRTVIVSLDHQWVLRMFDAPYVGPDQRERRLAPLGLPEGFVVLAAFDNFRCRTIDFLVQHPSFAVVPAGCESPPWKNLQFEIG